MTEPYPNWTSHLGSRLIRHSVESYLDTHAEAAGLPPEVVLAEVGLVLIGQGPSNPHESFIAQVASAEAEIKLINAEKVLREIARYRECRDQATVCTPASEASGAGAAS